MSFHSDLRREICETAHRVYAKGWVAGTDGNVSARLDDDRLLISPSGCCLGMMSPEEVIEIDFGGEPVSGLGRPSSERWMHIAAYQQRPDISAAIHAHAPATVAFTLAGVAMEPCALPEVILSFGRIPVTNYATPGTKEGAEIIRDLIQRHDALVLDRHGALTVGKSMREAFFKLDKLEHGAQVLLLAHGLGRPQSLGPQDIAKLASLREEMGLGRADDVPQ